MAVCYRKRGFPLGSHPQEMYTTHNVITDVDDNKEEDEMRVVPQSSTPVLTHDQYQKLMSLLQHPMLVSIDATIATLVMDSQVSTSPTSQASKNTNSHTEKGTLFLSSRFLFFWHV